MIAPKTGHNQILNFIEVSIKMDTSFLFICMLIENYGVSLQ
jgi:hypothetical protein